MDKSMIETIRTLPGVTNAYTVTKRPYSSVAVLFHINVPVNVYGYHMTRHGRVLANRIKFDAVHDMRFDFVERATLLSRPSFKLSPYVECTSVFPPQSNDDTEYVHNNLNQAPLAIDKVGIWYAMCRTTLYSINKWSGLLSLVISTYQHFSRFSTSGYHTYSYNICGASACKNLVAPGLKCHNCYLSVCPTHCKLVYTGGDDPEKLFCMACAPQYNKCTVCGYDVYGEIVRCPKCEDRIYDPVTHQKCADKNNAHLCTQCKGGRIKHNAPQNY